MNTQMKKYFLSCFICASIALLLSSCSCSHETTKTPSSTKTMFSFLGAPGSGKGTLAEQCVKQLGFITVAAGNLCRAEVATGSPKGKAIQEHMMSSGLIPDQIITEMIANWFSNQKSFVPIILDGYPRTATQAQLFVNLLKNELPDYQLRAIYLEVSDYEEVVKRISSRLLCENKNCQAVYNRTLLKNPTHLICDKCGSKLIQREDDTEEVVRKRLETFAANNNQIIAFYASIGIPVETLNVSHKSAEQIFEDFKHMIKK